MQPDKQDKEGARDLEVMEAVSYTEKVMVGFELEGGEGTSHVVNWEKSISSKGNSKYKSPRVHMCLESLVWLVWSG